MVSKSVEKIERPPNFETLTGEAGWSRLHPAIRRRFSNHDLRVTYPGELSVRASLFGLIFAWLLQPFGNPRPLTRTRIFKAEVKVFPEEGGALNFASRNYFIRWGKLRMTVPLWLTPVRTLVEHIDEGSGNFRFRLTMTHPWFGRTIYQDGIFSDPFGEEG